MQKSAFDINTMINDVAIYDQAVSASAANIKTNFDTQIAGISESFIIAFQAIDATIAMSATNFNLSFGTSALMLIEQFNLAFLAIDTAALNSSVMLSTNLLASLALINAGLTATQLLSDLSFSLMSVNALTLFTVAATGIVGIFAILNAAAAVCCTGIELSFSASLLNITTAFGINFTLINTLWAAATILLLATTTTNAASITAVMLSAFTLIVAGITASSILVNGILDGVKSKFEETAQGAIISFSDAQNGITESMNTIGTVSTENTTKSNSGWLDLFDSSSKLISGVNGGLGIFKSLRDIFAKTQETTSTLTQVLNINKGMQISNTAVTATAGATASSTALSVLAFGGGVLALGAGVLLAGMALALLAKTVFNFLKMSGLGTNGVKATDFDLSFSVPGLASGGFPSMGQMFIAREAGPELVGTIGSRSAVVNNNQIVESVSSGVYRAVRDATGGGADSIIQVFIGNDQLDEYIVKSQRRRTLQTNGVYA